MTDSRFDIGMKVRKEVLGSEHVERAQARTTEFDAEFQRFITETAWGSVWARPDLDRRTRSLVTIAILAALGREGHRLLLMGLRRRGAGQAIERPIQGEDTTAGARREMDTELGQGGVNPELAQLRVGLEVSDRGHRLEVHLACRVLGGMRLVVKPAHAFGNPALEHLIDARPRGLQVCGDRRDGPALGMQAHHGEAPLGWVGDLLIGRVAPAGPRRRPALGQDALDRVRAGAAAEPDVADGGQFVRAEPAVRSLPVPSPTSARLPPALAPSSSLFPASSTAPSRSSTVMSCGARRPTCRARAAMEEPNSVQGRNAS